MRRLFSSASLDTKLLKDSGIDSLSSAIVVRQPGMCASAYDCSTIGSPKLMYGLPYDLPRILPALSRPSADSLLLAAPRNSLVRSEEHTSELQSLMRISYAVFCLKKKTIKNQTQNTYVIESR